jgi:hypothetical protein
MTVLSLSGKPLDWRKVVKLPASEQVELPVVWSEKTSRGRNIYDCLFSIAQLDWMNQRAIEQFGAPLDIIQPMNNKGVKASEGTHDFGFCRDYWIKGVSLNRTNGLRIQRWARFECGCADWLRTPEQGFSYHIHGFALPPGGRVFPVKVGEYVDGGVSLSGQKYTSSQLEDYWKNALGLKGQHDPHDDPTPFPTSAQKMAGIFDLDKYIRNEMEKDMLSPKEWDKEDWAAVKNFLETEPMIDIRDPKTKKVKKTISITNAIQSIANEG